MEERKKERETTAWIEIIEAYFLPFIEFYFPDLYGYFTEHEYPRFEKRLFGNSTGLLAKSEENHFHVIVQNREEENCSEQLFTWAVETYLETGIFPATLLLLIDDNPDFYPRHFEIEAPGVYIRVSFNPAKLLYLKERIEVFRLRGNPFSFLSEAQLHINALRCRRGSRRGESSRRSRNVYSRSSFEELKKRLLYKLSREVFDSGCIRSLKKFLDRIIDPSTV